jgi:Asp-tRNA(Asn)/Glu-tRNA(Gln) amidotransferase C subunit
VKETLRREQQAKQEAIENVAKQSEMRFDDERATFRRTISQIEKYGEQTGRSQYTRTNFTGNATSEYCRLKNKFKQNMTK